MEWLANFFEYGFGAATTLGLAAFAMLIIVTLVALVVALTKSNPAFVFLIAIVCVVGLVIFNQLYPSPRPVESVGRQGQQPPAPPPPAAGNPPRWFDSGLQADWGGKDSFYGAGDHPAYAADGRILCDDTHLFQIATCWSSRPANSSSMAAGVPTNILQERNDWCAYKDNNVTLSKPPDGHAPPGRVYVCALSIPR
jgi:hypothetical protein